MSDYIERDAALEALCKASAPCFSATGKPILDVNYVPAINSIPAAPVREVRQGHWIYKTMTVPGGKGQTYGKWVCSECKSKEKERRNWCPNCGADMRAEERGAT